MAIETGIATGVEWMNRRDDARGADEWTGVPVLRQQAGPKPGQAIKAENS